MDTDREEDRPGGISTSKNEDLPEVIRDLDLGCIRFKLMQPESPVNWNQSQALLVEEEYRKFLALRLDDENSIIVPDAAIDVFWHQHILDTQKYESDCRNIFGEFMHHFPYFGLRGAEDAKELADGFLKTVKRYEKKFGTPPENMWSTAADCGRLGCAPGPPITP